MRLQAHIESFACQNRKTILKKTDDENTCHYQVNEIKL